jgi:hypothetical protein
LFILFSSFTEEGKMRKALLFGLVVIVILAGCSKPAKTGAEPGDAEAINPFDAPYAAFKSAFEAKNYGQALAGLRSLLGSFWAESALVLENAKFVKDENNSYGIYTPRENDVFAAGEPIYLYLEPAGYAMIKNPAGYFEFGFNADFQVADESGTVLGGKTSFAAMSFKSWNFNTEISLTFTYTLSGLEKGKYKIITQVSDAHSAKKASTERSLTIE